MGYSHGMFRIALSLYAALFLFPFLGESAPVPKASLQFGDVSVLPDETAALQKQIDNSKGTLLLAPGVHRITSTLSFKLTQSRSCIIRPASGAATLIMDGAGPAIRVEGSHQGTASPKSFDVKTWNERMPIIEGIEIVGNHPEADGIELFQTVEPVVSRVAVRWCRHGIRLAERNRNVTISDVHLYENQGVGLYLDDVNLHQINVSNSHISYNRSGGIVVRDGNVRNLQITGCDIEGNMPADDTSTSVANIHLDVSGSKGDRTKSIAEVAITGCTIQHSSNYSGKDYDALAPGGANIRLSGKEIWPIDSVTISGNVISDTSLNIEITGSTDVTVSGNTLFAPNPDNLRIAESKRVVVSGNTFNPRQFERPGRIRIENSSDCIISNCTFRALDTPDGAIIIEGSERILMNGNILTECSSGVLVKDSSDISLKNWIVSGLPEGVPFLRKEGETKNVVTD